MFGRIKCFFKGVWQGLWFKVRLRGDEFHSSLSLDPCKMYGMSPMRRARYEASIDKRRLAAEKEDLRILDREFRRRA